MMGVEEPDPGKSTFHAMFSVALHFVGSSLSGLVPWPVGPRNCGQSEPETELTKEAQRHREENKASILVIVPFPRCFLCVKQLVGPTRQRGGTPTLAGASG